MRKLFLITASVAEMPFGIYNCLLLCVLMLGGCDNSSKHDAHIGDKRLDHTISRIDTIQFEDDNLSNSYYLLMNDSCVVFADIVQCNLNFYGADTGALIDRCLSHGNGPKELSSMMYAATLGNSNGEIVIVTPSLGLYEYNPSADSLKYNGRMDFNWGKGERNNYEDVSNYNVMEMTDFAISFVKMDSSILVPLSIINKNFDKIDGRRYKEGHIFGELDPSTMKIDNLSGEFPASYEKRPAPFFEFFDFDVDASDNTLYYSFATDSLIYAKDKDGNLKQFGFEPQGINRGYTTGFESAYDNFMKDIKTVGVNTGLLIDESSKMILRTSMRNMSEGDVVLQGYDYDGNLLLEESMPAFFKLLGQRNGKYYGARLFPVEEDDTLYFQIYSFVIEPIL